PFDELVSGVCCADFDSELADAWSAGLFALAEGRVFPDGLGEGSSSGADLTELRPMENPMPKNTAHRITRPKKIASILPVPRVISVSLASSTRIESTGVM